MLNHLNNTVLKKNILNLNDNIHYNIASFNLYESIFNACKKNLLNKEIKFDNISTKQKKKDDENITSTNFIVNNFLNILNLNNIKNCFNLQKKINLKEEKKKLDKSVKLKFSNLKDKEKVHIEQNKKKYKIFQNHEISKNLTYFKNKYFLFDNYSIINLPKKFNNQNIFNKIININIKNQKKSIKYRNSFIYLKNFKKNISNIFISKNTYKSEYSIHQLNNLKKVNENNIFKVNKKSVLALNFKPNLQWKKLISQQILLSVSKKENEAEIYLKPESLGSIHIKINMKYDQAKLKFITDNIEIKDFLNSCIPFLRDSLIKNSIFLKKVNISSSFYSKNNKNLFTLEYKPKISNIIKNFYQDLKQRKNIDMYV